MPLTQADVELAAEISEYYDNPLNFVLECFPWGEPGELEKETGPDVWQRQFLIELGEEVRKRRFNGSDPVDPIRDATASGHGIGKSTLVAWLVLWIMSTRPHAKGTITANTYTQLDTKTWPAIQRWHKLCITHDWFVMTTDKMYHVDFKESWYCSPQSCKEENSEAFAGQHNRNSTSFYIFDEASAVPDSTFEVAEGGLTDGEPMIFAFGNPTRNTGKLYRVCFGGEQHRWRHRSIDSRNTKFANKKLLGEWEEDYGEDSDYFRVRARGLPPRASELQFIDYERIQLAQKRSPDVLDGDPLIAGVDVSGGGSAWTVVRFRRGLDARSVPPVRITGEKSRDRNMLVGVLAEVLSDKRPERRISAMFVDTAFGAAIVERLRVLGHSNVFEVNFGDQSPDPTKENMRAYMWSQCKDWLVLGAIPDDEKFASQLGLPGYHINRRNRLVLESKQDIQKRGEASPDDADALCLTFARAVAPTTPKPPRPPMMSTQWS